MKTYLVTGGAGFIGSSLCYELLNNDNKVINVFEIINLGNSSPISLKEMINMIAKTLNVKPKILKLPMQMGDVDRTYADITKAKKLIGYNPKTSFEQGIEKFVDWYKDNKDLYK